MTCFEVMPLFAPFIWHLALGPDGRDLLPPFLAAGGRDATLNLRGAYRRRSREAVIFPLSVFCGENARRTPFTTVDIQYVCWPEGVATVDRHRSRNKDRRAWTVSFSPPVTNSRQNLEAADASYSRLEDHPIHSDHASGQLPSYVFVFFTAFCAVDFSFESFP